MLLRQNFLGEIPRQQQRVVRQFFQQLFRRHDWQVHSGRQPALLVRVRSTTKSNVSGQVQKVQQRAAFGRGAVSRDGFALSFNLREQGTQRQLISRRRG